MEKKIEKKSNVYQMVIIAVMAAVMCILGPLSIPIGIVPISFTNLAIYFALYILGRKRGTMSYIIYMFIGFIGIPVFSGFTGGPSKLLGPTGGYLIGFILMAIFAGFFIDRFIDKRYLCFIGMVLGTIICYLFGSIWLSYQGNMSIYAALNAGVIPFIPGDLVKIFIATLVGPQIRRQLIKSHLF
ncbi:biotin transporter BioY [Garciella nitratireducens]|uniref:Biotin transporter n=1 Tax=Garciella nitratireducens DSM 15102 TaxID=1121911 RepID=A0A1T4LZM2_9FIRM|nr:biotin transporter BioY [Garciella nitratireducens]RBP44114.1 biotin transport system substrate-specific component [Garciella nitratireducens]SJZ60112.1 biotin transport system substrate-specific component [Garciella nitratireducens DSM 15102]